MTEPISINNMLQAKEGDLVYIEVRNHPWAHDGEAYGILKADGSIRATYYDSIGDVRPYVKRILERNGKSYNE